MASETSSQAPKYVGIVYLGMNKDAAAEGKLLFELNRDRGVAKVIRDAAVPDTLQADGQTFDLTTEEGARGWVTRLALAESPAEACLRLLRNAADDARDELAQLLEVYAQAERGERRMERVVFSGHSGGISIWGDDNGYLRFEIFERLAGLFPQAAGQVRDLMISACYSGEELQLERYRLWFPNLESIWAYAGSSPGTWSGAMEHMRIWERATELPTPARLDQDLAAGTRKGDNVAVWTLAGGYEGAERVPLEEAEARVAEGEPVFQRYFRGEASVQDPQNDPLRTYYRDVQRLVNHPDLTATRRAEVGLRRDVTLRLLFFSIVRSRFASTYAQPLREGYAQLQVPIPDFATLDRSAALASVSRYSAASAGQAGAAAEARRLLERGLRDLDPSVIPVTWT